MYIGAYSCDLLTDHLNDRVQRKNIENSDIIDTVKLVKLIYRKYVNKCPNHINELSKDRSCDVIWDWKVKKM